MNSMDDIHRILAVAARNLHSDIRRGPVTALAAITAAVVDTVPGADAAAVTLITKQGIRHHELVTEGTTDDNAVEFDRLQYATSQGPCLDAVTTERVMHMPDIDAESRWPDLTAQARANTDVRSSVSYQLFTHEHGMGALNVYSTVPHGFTPAAIEMGLSFATHAALVLDSTQKQTDFDSALASRDLIGQAKGIIIERFGVDATRAFELLVTLSQEQNIRVVDLARTLVERSIPLATGESVPDTTSATALDEPV